MIRLQDDGLIQQNIREKKASNEEGSSLKVSEERSDLVQ